MQRVTRYIPLTLLTLLAGACLVFFSLAASEDARAIDPTNANLPASNLDLAASEDARAIDPTGADLPTSNLDLEAFEEARAVDPTGANLPVPNADLLAPFEKARAMDPTGTTPPADDADLAADATGINATVYYTAVESYHPRTCLRYVKAWQDITTGGTKVSAGPYPCRFIEKVRNEGTGRITSGAHKGKYLNFSWEGLGPNGDQSGFWLDTAPRNSYGEVLQPFVSAAADPSFLPPGTRFGILDCGGDSATGEPMDATSCNEWKAADWQIQDQFTTGLGGANHIDLYIGEENMADFENRSPRYVDQSGVVLQWTS